MWRTIRDYSDAPFAVARLSQVLTEAVARSEAGARAFFVVSNCDDIDPLELPNVARW
jgi:hypothetical protein